MSGPVRWATAALWSLLFVPALLLGLWITSGAVASLPPSALKIAVTIVAYCIVILAWFQAFRYRHAARRRVADALSGLVRTVSDVYSGPALSDLVPSAVTDWFDRHPLTFGTETDTEVRRTTIEECSSAGCPTTGEEGYRKVTEFERVVAGRVVTTGERVVWERCADHAPLATASSGDGEETEVERATNRAETG